MRTAALIILLFIYLTSSCATSNTTSNYTAPNSGLRIFSYSMFPDRKFVVLSEHSDIDIANSILSSYSTNDLINALSIAYVQLPYEEQLYVSDAFKNTESLPYRFQESLVVAVTAGDVVHSNPTLNSLKDLLIVTYSNMSQQETQSRYYYGLTPTEQWEFNQRWNALQQQYQQGKQVQSKESGGFWRALGTIVVGIIAGYAAYRASTYNSAINNQLNNLQFQNMRIESQLNSIQNDLRRLAR